MCWASPDGTSDYGGHTSIHLLVSTPHGHLRPFYLSKWRGMRLEKLCLNPLRVSWAISPRCCTKRHFSAIWVSTPHGHNRTFISKVLKKITIADMVSTPHGHRLLRSHRQHRNCCFKLSRTALSIACRCHKTAGARAKRQQITSEQYNHVDQ